MYSYNKYKVIKMPLLLFLLTFIFCVSCNKTTAISKQNSIEKDGVLTDKSYTIIENNLKLKDEGISYYIFTNPYEFNYLINTVDDENKDDLSVLLQQLNVYDTVFFQKNVLLCIVNYSYVLDTYKQIDCEQINDILRFDIKRDKRDKTVCQSQFLYIPIAKDYIKNIDKIEIVYNGIINQMISLLLYPYREYIQGEESVYCAVDTYYNSSTVEHKKYQYVVKNTDSIYNRGYDFVISKEDLVQLAPLRNNILSFIEVNNLCVDLGINMPYNDKNANYLVLSYGCDAFCDEDVIDLFYDENYINIVVKTDIEGKYKGGVGTLNIIPIDKDIELPIKYHTYKAE